MKPGFEDMEKTFAEESNDLLVLMEESLLDIQENGINEENINAVFRAVHTIKGAGGIFNLGYLIEFSHNVEDLLDQIRTNKINLTEDILELLFKTKDQIQNLVNFAINSEGEDPNENIGSISQSLLHEVSLCLEDDYKNQENRVDEKSQTKKNSPEDSIDKEIEKLIEKNAKKRKNLKNKNYEININFNNEALLNGIEPLEFISALRELGEFRQITSDISSLPPINMLNVNEVFIQFEILLISSKTKKDIEEIFSLANDFCTLNIKEITNDIPKEYEQKETLSLVPSSKQSQDIQEDKKEYVQEKTDILAKSIITKPILPQKLSVPADPLTIKHASTLKVDAQKIDNLINLIGEMVIANSNVVEQVSKVANKELIESVSILSRMLEEMREASMQTRMVPIGDTFSRFKRIVRDLSRELNKDIELEIIGAATELDKTVVEKISDPLMHLVRNAIDHGIETPSERVTKQKEIKGKLILKAYHEAGSIVIEVSDDGKGLDPELLFQKAIEKELISKNDELSENEKLQLIMKPGFSTAQSITSVSGRGVGMDVVKRNIDELRGIIELHSTINQGTTIRIRLPLTLAIIDGFLTKVGARHFIIPLAMVVECIELKQKYKKEFKENKYINLRGHILSILDLREFFEVKKTKSKRENIVIVKFSNLHIGLIVNELQGEFQTVIKPLGKIFRNILGIGGATILGSGEVALILDVPMLMQNLNKSKENLKKVAK